MKAAILILVLLLIMVVLICLPAKETKSFYTVIIMVLGTIIFISIVVLSSRINI